MIGIIMVMLQQHSWQQCIKTKFIVLSCMHANECSAVVIDKQKVLSIMRSANFKLHILEKSLNDTRVNMVTICAHF